MASHLGLVMLLVKDIARERAFYTEYLGLEVAQEFSGDDFILLHARGKGISLALQAANDANGAYGVPTGHGGVIPAFAVEDADATYQQWKARGVDLVGDITDIGAGHSFTVRDPDGHYIQVYHLYPQVIEAQKKMGMLS